MHHWSGGHDQVLLWGQLPGVEDDAEHDDEERMECGQVVVKEDGCLAPHLSPGPGGQPCQHRIIINHHHQDVLPLTRNQPVHGSWDNNETDEEISDGETNNSNMRNLQHRPGTDPVSEEIDDVEDDTSQHGDAEESSVAPSCVEERILRSEEEVD